MPRERSTQHAVIGFGVTPELRHIGRGRRELSQQSRRRPERVEICTKIEQRRGVDAVVQPDARKIAAMNRSPRNESASMRATFAIVAEPASGAFAHYASVRNAVAAARTATKASATAQPTIATKICARLAAATLGNASPSPR